MAEWLLSDITGYRNGFFQSITSSASANTKGGWTTLVAATSGPSSGILLNLLATTQNRDFLTDLGIGAAGSEQVIVANLLHSYGNAFLNTSLYIPVQLPDGVRLAVRTQASTGSSGCDVAGCLAPAGYHQTSGSRVQTWGANTADSGGTSVDPGGVAFTYGAWSQLVAATAFPVHQILLAFSNQLNAASAVGSYITDLGIGAAGSEQVVITNLHIATHSTSDTLALGGVGALPLTIPAGTRVAVRAKSSITDATDRLFDVVGYGIT